METNLEEACNTILLSQLGLEDPEQFGDPNEIRPGTPAARAVALVRSVVREAVAAAGDAAGQSEAKLLVGAALGRTVERLNRACAALWRSGMYAGAGSDRSPLAAAAPPARSRREYSAYLAKLRALAAVVDRTRTSPENFEFDAEAAEEATTLAPVFRFLAGRQHVLRRRLHPSVCQGVIGESIAESSADRGDEAAALYHTIVVGTYLVEEPENWTLRDIPDVLRETVVGLLEDLHHLADAAEMKWGGLLKEADEAYKEVLRE